MLFPLLHPTSGWATYADPEIDKLLEEARQTLDKDEAARATTARCTRSSRRDVPLVPLYQAAMIYGAAKDLEWQPTPNESMFLNRMGWKD